jgi:hypothetical protein
MNLGIGFPKKVLAITSVLKFVLLFSIIVDCLLLSELTNHNVRSYIHTVDTVGDPPSHLRTLSSCPLLPALSTQLIHVIAFYLETEQLAQENLQLEEELKILENEPVCVPFL